ncbi:hypothetical protein DOY81_008015 [Sarcophaga bullata]|nr:hypothetical protein DOY81_008015 [Sarcophaga bullata]
MKSLVIFALALATVSAFDLRNAKLKQRNVVVPVMKTEGRITNGYNAHVGQFPYQVGLSLKINAYIYSWCGASIIGQEYLLTAAHCVDRAESVTIYFGTTNLNDPEKTVTVDRDAFIIHEGWNSQTFKNDIALIRIPTITYTDKIQPVQLPAISTVLPNICNYAYMRVISNADCKKTYGPIVTPSNICVSTYYGISTCQGDSGGPLVLDSSKVLIGLTSFGSTAGCTLQLPAAFTRGDQLLPWIRLHTGI